MPDSLFYNTDALVDHPVTIKKRATAEEIRADLQGRIERMIARDAKFKGCEAPTPMPIPSRSGGAANWTVTGFPNLAPGCFTALVQIVDQARQEYELVS
jgi:hypothetical protein